MFNLRVYGVLINDQNQVLVTDELIRGMHITKFPGGGLEFGEGTRDCLKREFKEEMNLDVTVGDHIYTTDYFQRSAFNSEHQIISIYYFVHANEEIKTTMREIAFDFSEDELKIYNETGETQVFRFIHMDDFSEGSMSLPIDKLVAEIVRNNK